MEVQPDWPNQTDWPKNVEKGVGKIGKKIGKALGRIFKF
jgi:hypothetical protein